MSKSTAKVSEPHGAAWRRREPRLPCIPTGVSVALTERDETITGQVIDVSASGLRLKLENVAPIGASVRVAIGESMTVIGQIRHCRRNSDGSFDTGVMIDE